MTKKQKSLLAMGAIALLAMPVAYAINSFGTIAIGGGYGSTGVTLYDTGNVSMNGNLVVDGTTTLSGGFTSAGTLAGSALTAGGGYGSTGSTFDSSGNGQLNGALTVDGATTLGTTTTVGGGYGSTGSTFSSAGDISANGALIVDGAGTFGGGYGSTGVSISTSGTIQGDGNLAIGGTAAITGNTTLTSVDIGGGYGSTGITGTSAGNLNADGNLTIGGTATVAGNSSLLSVDIGGGYGSTGATVTSGGAASFDGALTAISAEIGGGYSGGSGVTISSAGALQASGALDFDGYLHHYGSFADICGGSASNGLSVNKGSAVLTALPVATTSSLTSDSLSVGGGYGSTGTTISSAGAISTDGAIIGGSTLAITGATTLSSTCAVTGALSAPSININSGGAISNLVVGTYTPTTTSVANVASSSGSTSLYKRTGDLVEVFFSITVTPTAGSTLTQVGFSIPISSNIGTLYGDSSHQSGSTVLPGAIVGDTTNDRAELRFVSSGTGSHIFRGSLGYLVQ